MNVCENTRGWPSIVLAGVLVGFPAGPLPWVTFPETVTNSDGGCVPDHSLKPPGESKRMVGTDLG
jgi:hypothetical protein